MTLGRTLTRSWMAAAGLILGGITWGPGVLTADGPGGGCSEGCHRDAYWKKDGDCIRAEKTTCCTDAWAVATGGSRQNLTDDVKHWIDADPCTELCVEKSDSVAYPWDPINPPVEEFGTFTECICSTGGGPE